MSGELWYEVGLRRGSSRVTRCGRASCHLETAPIEVPESKAIDMVCKGRIPGGHKCIYMYVTRAGGGGE